MSRKILGLLLPFLCSSNLLEGKSLPLITPVRSVFNSPEVINKTSLFLDIGSSGVEVGCEISPKLRLGFGGRENWTKYKEFGNPTRQSLWSRGISAYIAWHRHGPKRQGLFTKISPSYEKWLLHNSFKDKESTEFTGHKFGLKPSLGYQWIWASNFNIKVAFGNQFAIEEDNELVNERDWDDFWLTRAKEGSLATKALYEPQYSYSNPDLEISLGLIF